MANVEVSIMMGSESDWSILKDAAKTLEEFGVTWEAKVLSAHRTPAEAAQYGAGLKKRGVKVLIAAAGLAAHLPGVMAAHTTLPVIGVPIANGPLNGQDALLSIVQMPPGIPVATMAINGSKNAAIFALQILAEGNSTYGDKLLDYRAQMAKKVLSKSVSL